MAVAGDIIIELKLDDKDVAVNVKRAGTVLQQFQTTLNQTATSVKRLEIAHDSLGTKFRHLVMTLGHLRFVAMDVNDVFLRLPMAILKSAGEMERMQVLMKGLSKELTEVGKAREGVRDFNFVTGMAKRAPFEIAALSDSFVKFKNAGLDPTNGSLNALVDSVARFGGNSESLKRSSVAIQQMAGKGVISMEELRQQLGEAVPSAMQDMADGMGVSMAKLAKIVQSGTLEATPAINKMLLQMQINNQGAAAEMMKTWGGTLSQLKTEWDLTAKFIADNGFGNAAKDSVNAIVEGLRSADFRSFAGDAGAALGSTVKTIGTVVKTLVEYRSEIKLLVEAWLAYKVMFSVIAPMGRALEKTARDTAASLNGERAALMSVARDRTEGARQAIEQSRSTALAERTRSANLITAKMLETELIRAENARVLADYTRLNAALDAADARRRGGVLIPGVQGAMRKDEARKQLQDMSMAMEQNSRVARDNATEIARHQLAMQASARVVAEKTGLLAKLGAGYSLAGVGATAAAAGTRLFSGAMALMGGPIGLAIAAISALVWWYGRSAAAAEESAARQRRANSNTSTKEDVTGAKKELAEAEAQMRDLQSKASEKFTREDVIVNNMVVDNQPGHAKTAKDIERETKDLRAAAAKVNELRDTVEKAGISVSEQNSRAATDMINLSVDRKVKVMETATQKEIAQLEDDRRKKVEGLKKDSKEYQDIVNASNKAKQNVELEGVKARIESESRAIKSLENSAKNAKGDDKVAIEMAASARRALRADMEKNRDFIETTMVTEPTYKDKAGKKAGGGMGGPVVNKIDNFIGNLREQNARLGAMLPGLTGNIGKADEIVAALDELEQKFKDKDFTQKVKGKDGKVTERGPTDAEKNTMRDLTEQNAKFKMLASDAKKVADEVNKMGPDYEHALKVIADPLGASEQKQTNKFDEMITKLRAAPHEFAKFAADMGLVATSFDGLIAKMEEGRAKAATIDLAGHLAGQADDNRKLSLELIEDDRERARQQAAIAQQLASRQAASAIAEFERAKVSADRIDAYKAQVDLNAALRAKDLAMKMRTPIEVAADSWAKSTRAMEGATAQWADQSVDAFVNMAKTGKFEFSSLVQSILADMLKIKVKENMAPLLKEGGNALTGYVSRVLNLNPSKASADAATPGVSGGYPSADAAAIQGVAFASEETTKALSEMVSTGISASTEGLAKTALTAIEGAAVSTTMNASTGMTATSLGLLSVSAEAAAIALQSMAATSAASAATSGGGDILGSFIGAMGFADGGIMTNFGAVPLRKYAAGGIARSPQLALYGEAGPEAYVPLPDGRSIPVTMKVDGVGAASPGAAPNVTVNVINQSTQAVSAQQGSMRFDGKSYILDVVMTAASQPGGFRNGLKEAVK